MFLSILERSRLSYGSDAWRQKPPKISKLSEGEIEVFNVSRQDLINIGLARLDPVKKGKRRDVVSVIK